MFCPLLLAATIASGSPMEAVQTGYGYCEEDRCAWWIPKQWHNEGYPTAFETPGHCIIKELGNE